MKINRTMGQYIVAGVILVLFLVVVHRFILPVVFGLLISLIFRPLYMMLDNRMGRRHHLAAITSTVILLIGFLLPLIVMGILIAKDASQFLSSIVNILKDGNLKNGNFLEIPALSKIYEGANAIHPISHESFNGFIKLVLSKTGGVGSAMLTGMAAAVPKMAFATLLFLVGFYFGLVDGPKLVRFLRKSSPFTEKKTEYLFKRTHQICNAVVLGAFAAGLVQGTMLSLAFWILGIPRPALAGVITLFSAFIPLMGAAPAGLGGTLFLLFNGKVIPAIIMFAIFLIASITDNVVKPWVLKGKTELHPLLGLLSVLGGMTVFGLTGIFLGPLVVALTISFIELRKNSGSEEETSNIGPKKNVKIVASSG